MTAISNINIKFGLEEHEKVRALKENAVNFWYRDIKNSYRGYVFWIDYSDLCEEEKYEVRRQAGVLDPYNPTKSDLDTRVMTIYREVQCYLIGWTFEDYSPYVDYSRYPPSIVPAPRILKKLELSIYQEIQ